MISQYVVAFSITVAMYVALALSWNLISGFTGYVNLGHVSLFGLGAYTSALLMARAAWPWYGGWLAGGVMAAVVALPLGMVLLRIRGPYFAVATLGLNEVMRIVAEVWQSLTFGGQGVHLPPNPRIDLVFWGMTAVAVVALVLTRWVDRSRFGLWLVAIRDDEEAADAMGINTTRAKVTAFVLAAGLAGLVGGLYPFWLSYLDPMAAFRPLISINIVIMAMFGGAGTVWGPVVGAVVLSLVAEKLWSVYPNLYLAVFGGLMVLVILFMPRGLLPLLQQKGLLPGRRSYLLQKGGADIGEQ